MVDDLGIEVPVSVERADKGRLAELFPAPGGLLGGRGSAKTQGFIGISCDFPLRARVSSARFAKQQCFPVVFKGFLSGRLDSGEVKRRQVL